MDWSKSYENGNAAVHVRFREPRTNVRLMVYYGQDEESVMTNYSINMSAGGIFIESETPLPVDTPLVVKFKLPVNDKQFRCTSRVAWTNDPADPKSELHPSGMGLQFLDLPLEDMNVIRNYIEEVGLTATW